MNTLKESILIRCDASESIGIGHVMRMAALASELVRSDFVVHFVMSECPEVIAAFLLDKSFNLVHLDADCSEIDDLTSIADSLNASWVILDNYSFDQSMYSRVIDRGFRLLVMDDYGHNDVYSADLLVNQNASASTLLYDGKLTGARTPRLLLGLNYVLLRDEFVSYNGPEYVVRPSVSGILVTMGGADSNGVNFQIAESLVSLSDDIQVTFLTSEVNKRAKELNAHLQNLNCQSGPRFRLLVDKLIDPEFLTNFDLLISAGGTTIWEACVVGAPTICIITAENQKGVMKLGESHAIKVLGYYSELDNARIKSSVLSFSADYDTRVSFSKQSRALIDGQGTRRVADAIRGLI